jgi:hypothetical protein
VTHNNRLQRTVRDKVPKHRRQRAAAEPERYTEQMALRMVFGIA